MAKIIKKLVAWIKDIKHWKTSRSIVRSVGRAAQAEKVVMFDKARLAFCLADKYSVITPPHNVICPISRAGPGGWRYIFVCGESPKSCNISTSHENGARSCYVLSRKYLSCVLHDCWFIANSCVWLIFYVGVIICSSTRSAAPFTEEPL